MKKKIITIASALVIIFCLIGIFAGGGKEKEEEKLQTVGGLEYSIIQPSKTKDLAAVARAIEERGPEVTDPFDIRDSNTYEYSDGMKWITFSVDGMTGGCYLEWINDDDYSVHFLDINGTEYINDGIDQEQYAPKVD